MSLSSFKPVRESQRQHRNRLRSVFGGALIGAAMVLTGCAHTYKWVNQSYYRSAKPDAEFRSQPTIGVTGESSDLACRQLVDEVTLQLGKYDCFANVKSHFSRKNVDYTVDLNIAPAYSGSGWNFLVSWPGFCIFTPAWHGYNYEIELDARVKLKSTQSLAEKEFHVPVTMDIRQADLGRSWVSGCGWFLLTTPAFVGGLFHIGYNSDITDMMVTKSGPDYGKYVAAKIVEELAVLDQDQDRPGKKAKVEYRRGGTAGTDRQVAEHRQPED